MGRIVRELKTLPGAILGITVLLIVTFFVLNFLQTRTPAPISTAAGWAFGHASGQVYGSPVAAAAPAMATSPYGANNNVGSYM